MKIGFGSVFTVYPNEVSGSWSGVVLGNNFPKGGKEMKNLIVFVLTMVCALFVACEKDSEKQDSCFGNCDEATEVCVDSDCYTKCVNNDDCFNAGHGGGWVCRAVENVGGYCDLKSSDNDQGIPDNTVATCVPSVETCDNKDNDCDGAIDEGVKNACGKCGAVPTEVCDDVDNDCDNATDEGVKNACGQCGPVPVEVCDSADNDCDSVTDEGCSCSPPGKTETCGTDVGVCELGERTCGNDYKWGACLDLVAPVAEKCNGVDDDCDGSADEDFAFASDVANCGTCGNKCSVSNAMTSCVVGECYFQCLPSYFDIDGNIGCEYQCVATNGGVEQCDGIDNDCDGLVDEDFDLSSNLDHCGSCNSVCETNSAEPVCFVGLCFVMDCDFGYVDLNGLPGDGCEYDCTYLGEEQCNGSDDDCDGSIDELVFCNCVDDDIAYGCGTGNVGDCKQGYEVCDNGSWGLCQEVVWTSPEKCDNHDNDCDGSTDEDFDLLTDSANCGFCGHACLADQAGTVCADGQCYLVSCQFGWFNMDGDYDNGCEYPCYFTSGGVEQCDGIDNDCDSKVDEIFDLANHVYNCGACGIECNLPQANSVLCVSGQCEVVSCNVGYYDLNGQPSDGCEYQCTPAGVEVCDNLDNDCDGTADEAALDCACDSGDIKPCGSNVGDCHGGFQICSTDGAWGGCFGEVIPQPEVCDNDDNDCDGNVDEDFNLINDESNCGYCGNICSLENAKSVCTFGLYCLIETCTPGFYNANEKADDGCEYACWPTKNGVEACDNVDNDCDGVVDEDFDLKSDLGNCGSCGHVCKLFKADATCALGECSVVDCQDNYYDLNGQAADGCEYSCTVSNAGIEVGDNLDNDCDGSVDEDTGCFEENMKSCGSDVGLCEYGWQLCKNGKWGDCLGGVSPQPEGCGGSDDDCDGAIDEDFDLMSDESNCGACGFVCSLPSATSVCTNGQCKIDKCDVGFYDLNKDVSDGCEYACFKSKGGVEACDGVDNDCDGAVDEGFDLLSDASNCGQCGKTCGAIFATTECVLGECKVAECTVGHYDLNKVYSDGCEYDCTPNGVEACNGVDANCDGKVNQDCACTLGMKDACGNNLGLCKWGMITCVDGQWSDCLGGVSPSEEVCDGADNDCNGVKDNGFDLQSDPMNCGACGNVCSSANSEAECSQGKCVISTCWVGFYDLNKQYADGCEYSCFKTKNGVEVCDEIDNDCDGTTDEDTDFASDESNCGACGVKCNFPNAGFSCKVGKCVMEDCQSNYYNLNGFTADGCEYFCVVTNAGVEVGDNLDNDCDGDVDEGTACLEGNMKSCGSNVGACETGWQTCEAGAWGGCKNDIPPMPETCDGVDNDCDGSVDEDFAFATDVNNCGSCGIKCSAANASVSCVMGQCTLVSCSASYWNLNGQASDGCEYQCVKTLSGVEKCDGIDNDCDGLTDEDTVFATDKANCGACGNNCDLLFATSATSCSASACKVISCFSGYYDVNGIIADGCEYKCSPTNAGEEICDGVDNDCDGSKDEGCPLTVVSCNVCCSFGVGQPVLWWGNDPPFMWTGEGESCGTATMTVTQICLRGDHPSYTDAGWVDYNCNKAGVWTGWKAADVLSCVDQNGVAVSYSVITGTVDAGGEAEIILSGVCPQ